MLPWSTTEALGGPFDLVQLCIDCRTLIDQIIELNISDPRLYFAHIDFISISSGS